MDMERTITREEYEEMQRKASRRIRPKKPMKLTAAQWKALEAGEKIKNGAGNIFKGIAKAAKDKKNQKKARQLLEGFGSGGFSPF